MKRNFFNPGLEQLAAIAERNELEMAAPTDKPIKLSGLPEQEVEQLRLQFNNLLAAFRIAMAKLDLDAGVTDVNYFLLTCDTAMGAAVVPTKLTVL